MRILYLGDVMGRPGREAVARFLPQVCAEYQPDLVVAQAENVSHGKGMTPEHMRELQRCGVQFFTGGNHILEKAAIHPYLADPDEPVIRCINHTDAPGLGAKTIATKEGTVLVISLLGQLFPQTVEIGNSLEAIDAELEKWEQTDLAAVLVDFHGDYSSQKRIIGYYLDGRVSAVVCDHWHVPTADAMVLPKGTAHITDVGMCGTVHSSIGIELEDAINRWKHPEERFRFRIEEGPSRQFNAVLIETDGRHGAKSIRSINILSDV